jgi:adenosine deaminase
VRAIQDPALLGTGLAGEYALCRKTFGWTDAVTAAVARTSISLSQLGDWQAASEGL